MKRLFIFSLISAIIYSCETATDVKNYFLAKDTLKYVPIPNVVDSIYPDTTITK